LVRFCVNLEEPKKFRWLSICGHLIVEAIKKLPVQSCFIDGEAIVVDQTGCRSFTCSAAGNTTAPPYSARST
jgi:hypothetical protein